MGSRARISSKYLAGVTLGALLSSAFLASCSDDDHPIEVAGSAGISRSGAAGQAGRENHGGSSGHGGHAATEGGRESKGGSTNDSGGSGGSGADGGSSAGNSSAAGSGGVAGHGGTSVGGASGLGGTSGSSGSAGTAGKGGSGGSGGLSNGGTSNGGTSNGGTSSGGGGSTAGGTAGSGTAGFSGVSGGSAGTSGGGASSTAGVGGTAGSPGASGGGGTSSGGTSGGGGTASGGAPSCPTNFCSTPYVDANCGPVCTPITSSACVTCEQTDTCDDEPCEDLSTVAQAGPAQGTARSTLCNEALSCFRTSACMLAATDFSGVMTACYCGSIDSASCQTNNANGPCKLEMERSFETTDKALIQTRLGVHLYGGGTAFYRVDCDKEHCANSACFNITP